MAKYHISEDGNPRPCRATKNPCRFGDAQAHYETKEDARDAYELSQKVIAFEKKDPEEASIESLDNIILQRPSNGLDLPAAGPRMERRELVRRHLLTGNVRAAQEAAAEWLAEARSEDLPRWKNALAERSLATRSFINADPVKLQKHIDANYLRPHAVNPRDPNEVRGVLIPKVEGWSVDPANGNQLVHENGMRLKMTPGYAAMSGWSIDGPEGWRDKYFKTSSGLYPVANYELLNPRTLKAIASYGS